MSLRTKKVESLILREISSMLQKQEVKDPRIGFVTVIKVDISPDMRNAKVYVSFLGDKKQRRKSLTGLRNASGYIQTEIAHKVRMRYFPELIFEADKTLEYRAEIDDLLNKIYEKKPYAKEDNIQDQE